METEEKRETLRERTEAEARKREEEGDGGNVLQFILGPSVRPR